jgi:hypothetical protein
MQISCYLLLEVVLLTPPLMLLPGEPVFMTPNGWNELDKNVGD